MSTPQPSTLEAALGGVPSSFRSRILEGYRSIKSAFADNQFDTCGTRTGKLCEVLIRYLQHTLTGTHVPFGRRIPNLTDECNKLERLPATTGHESYRLIIPRALNFAYTLRNKRDAGHIGGDVDANEIDAATVVRVMDWCLSEIIRVTLAVPLEDAQAILDAIAERQIPLVWSAPGGKKRVLDPALTQREQTLVLLYSDIDGAIPIEDLAKWVDNPRLSNYRSRIVERLHQDRYVEFDDDTLTVSISPTGVTEAEAILKKTGALS